MSSSTHSTIFPSYNYINIIHLGNKARENSHALLLELYTHNTFTLRFSTSKSLLKSSGKQVFVKTLVKDNRGVTTATTIFTPPKNDAVSLVDGLLARRVTFHGILTRL